MMKHCHNGQFMLDEGEDENVDVMGQNGNGDDRNCHDIPKLSHATNSLKHYGSLNDN